MKLKRWVGWVKGRFTIPPLPLWLEMAIGHSYISISTRYITWPFYLFCKRQAIQICWVILDIWLTLEYHSELLFSNDNLKELFPGQTDQDNLVKSLLYTVTVESFLWLQIITQIFLHNCCKRLRCAPISLLLFQFTRILLHFFRLLWHKTYW